VNSSITYLLVDLDETLYPASSGMVEEISRRMTRYVSQYLKLDEDNAARIRRELSQKHGATLTGLMTEHNFTDPESYLEFVHPTDVGRYLHKDPELASTLSSVAPPKSILTNAPREHARRILEYLEIAHLFERIFDIRTNDFRGKPEKEIYHRVLTELNRKAPEVLFVDNRIDYLLPFKKIGGKILWVAEEDSKMSLAEEVPRITSVKELPEFLRNL
jgi:putative hydrolase of the HAD superfamily